MRAKDFSWFRSLSIADDTPAAELAFHHWLSKDPCIVPGEYWCVVAPSFSLAILSSIGCAMAEYIIGGSFRSQLARRRTGARRKSTVWGLVGMNRLPFIETRLGVA